MSESKAEYARRHGWDENWDKDAEHPCEWDDCEHVDAEDSPEFGWLCSAHYGEAWEETHADTANSMRKEDDIR